MTPTDPTLLLFVAGILTGVWLSIVAMTIRELLALMRLLRSNNRS